MQNFSNPAARNMSRAAGGPQPVPTMDRGKPRDLHMPASGTGTGTGKGMINDKVNVAMPAIQNSVKTASTEVGNGGGLKLRPKGFDSGLISSKV